MRDYLRSVVRHSWPPQDPRVYQIVALAGLLGYGVIWLDFAVSGVQTLVILATVLPTHCMPRNCARSGSSGSQGQVQHPHPGLGDL